MPRDSISREPSLPQGESFPIRSFRRTYPLVAAGHLLALLLCVLLAKFMSNRSSALSFFSPVSVGRTGVGAGPPLRSHAVPGKPPPYSTSGAAPTPKEASPVGKLPGAAMKPPPAPAAKKHGEPPRKPLIRPNLQEVTRALPAAAPRRARPSPQTVSSQTSPPGNGEAAGESASNSSSLGPGWYYSLIRDRLYAAWDQPLGLSNQNLVARVQIFVAKDGRISKPVLLSPSANEEFDRTVLAAAHQVDTVGEPRPSDVPEIVTVTFRMVH
ncbi:TonB C-terminal domain-containing protein [Methylacidimicrobium sp. B4]|uniref:TonB C-terminal domain-containing protein n=1 Tax=Methylacidimicrobium sp. B4 TaxID=2796139 RepID=UPI001A8DC0FF|nr:TonB C-terminal domain-containing protein [Methylacidimicrobium sp. B4]QSR84057.1 TonB C-terminal domain-containing protein [Methylacidimicrobium sp. B4]